MKLGRVIAAVLAALISAVCLTSCNKEEPVELSEYSGILTRVKLGMPLTKIVTMQPDGVELYYENDTQVWSINNDTELREVASLIPEESAYYYADDSIITYNFRTVNGDDEIYLNGYMQEISVLMDRETARKYFAEKTLALENKHGEHVSTMIGVEDIDMTLTYKETFNCPSYTVVFSYQETYETVDNVDGYYGTFFSIEVTEKDEKDEIASNLNPDSE